ncbi:lymphocyte antigen 6H-like [Eumetopias jubatus]|uniref:lymphocyte antigen 6H-like n=1 Tax=Eumetopias jubatus TaxID=34886 RepID=UPI00101658B0|nr:lymphocyte antigen 6H-like [Eumetopias jubatus]XP_027952846.1 lymphocyte antigen 6H-like [Eumetopias jubatus]
MRGVHLLLLALPLRWEHALSLQCYTCADMNSSPCQSFQCLMHSVCYTVNISLTTNDGKQVKYKQKGCAPSCKEVSSIMEQLSKNSGPGDSGLLGLAKLEVQGLMCCEEDLCNGGSQLLGPGGGLLLSLGPVFVWALL